MKGWLCLFLKRCGSLRCTTAVPMATKRDYYEVLAVARDAAGVGLEWCEALQDGLGVVARLAQLTNNDVQAPVVSIQPLLTESRPRHSAAQAHSRR